MIFGIGIDLIEVKRIKATFQNFPKRFPSRVFTENEIKSCESVKNKYLSYAARFAAKEAFSKALGTGLRGKISWKEVEVIDNERTRPSLKITGKAKEYLKDRAVHLSLSHTENYATAIVIIEST